MHSGLLWDKGPITGTQSAQAIRDAVAAKKAKAEEQQRRQEEKEATRRAREETRLAAAVELKDKLNDLFSSTQASQWAGAVNRSFKVEELKSLLMSINVSFASAEKNPALIDLLLERWPRTTPSETGAAAETSE